MANKTWKKLFSALLAVSILMCGMIVPMSAFAATDVVFELDAATLTDKSETKAEITQAGTVKNGSFVNLAGDIVPYITTGDVTLSRGDTANSGNLGVTNAAVAGLTTYTVEAWAKYNTPNNSNVYPGLFGQYGTDNKILVTYLMDKGNHGFRLMGQTSGYSLANSVTSAAGVDGSWCHYVFTVEPIYTEGVATGMKYRGYLNGAKKGSNENFVFDDAAKALFGTGNNFIIGGTPGYGFPGDIAEFRIYNTVKTDAEIAKLHSDNKDRFIPGIAAEEGEVLLDVDPVTLTDRSGNDIAIVKKGTITGGSFMSAGGEIIPYMTTGKEDAVANGSNNGALRITDVNITKLKDYTLELWAKYKKPTTANPKMFTQRVGGKVLLGYEMSGTNAHKFVWYDENSMTGMTSADALKDQWHHYVLTFDTIYDSEGNITGAWPILYIDGKVKVKPGSAYTAYLSYVGQADSFSIGGDTADNYHLGFPADIATAKIYKGVKTASEISAMYDATASSFEELTSIRPSLGQVVVNMGKEIAKPGAVKLQKTTDNGLVDVKGGAYASVDPEDATKLIVEFGMLEDNTQYQLTVDKALSFTDKDILDVDKVISFTTGKGLLIDTDFDDVTTETLHDTGLTFVSKNTMGSTENVTVEEITLADGSTDKVVRIQPKDNTTGYRVMLNLEEPLTKKETMLVEEKARTYDASEEAFGKDVGILRVLRFGSSAGTTMPNNAPVYYTSNSKYHDNTTDKFTDVASQVAYSNDTNTFWTTRTAKSGASDTSLNLGITDINSVWAMEASNRTGDYNDYSEISSFKVQVGIAPAILNVSYDKAANALFVVFNDDMTNVSSDTLKLLSRNDGMDTEVNVTSVVYNEATRTAVVTPETALSTGSYLLNVTDVVSPTSGIWNGYKEVELFVPVLTSVVTVTAGEAVVNAGEAIPTGTTVLSATATFDNTTATAMNAVVVAALYDASGKLLKVSQPADAYAAANNGTDTKTVTIDEISTKAGDTMKVFIWNSLSGLSPWFEAYGVGAAVQ